MKASHLSLFKKIKIPKRAMYFNTSIYSKQEISKAQKTEPLIREALLFGMNKGFRLLLNHFGFRRVCSRSEMKASFHFAYLFTNFLPFLITKPL